MADTRRDRHCRDPGVHPKHAGKGPGPKDLADEAHCPPTHEGELTGLHKVPEHPSVSPIVVAWDVKGVGPNCQGYRQCYADEEESTNNDAVAEPRRVALRRGSALCLRYRNSCHHLAVILAAATLAHGTPARRTTESGNRTQATASGEPTMR